MLFPTKTGSATGYPILADQTSAASIIAANAGESENDMVFAALAFGQCPMWRSGYIKA